ncbi:hypothetical protein WH87_12945 [Devosia epidermidihirudinis]|uniref:sn-glycerol-3-phosphate-binding periplasmic protein UgpB n=1 Tax=Devosia epidermidihirudinis TaxID=1293439 RepID=A0A0F5Q9L4_9HYPH|nr:sugar ABC transporter substrate-binding protein [Devosia epidermidihirudinis]KKC37426.1 hypothetical protein WH87_12945 [Devosia epidermidihirudinis]
MNKLLLVTTALALAFAAPAMAETKVSFAYWGDPAELPPFEKIVADYEAANPDVKIEVQHAPWSGYFTRLDAQLAAGAGPDVFFITNVPTYAARGQLEPLDKWIADKGFPIDQFNPEALLIHQLDDVLYSVPRDNDTNVLYYNKAAFDEAGVAYPTADWDWAALRDAAIKLTVTDGGRITRYGLAIEKNNWSNWVRQNGGTTFDHPTRPTKFTLDEPKGLEAIQFIGDLINVDKVTPNFTELDQAGGTGQLFSSQQAAIVFANAARLGTFADADFEWAVAPLPKGPTGIRSNSLGGAGFGINPNAKDKEAAWNFFAYLAGEPGQVVFASANASAVPAQIGNAAVKAAFKAPFADVFLSEAANGKLNASFPKYVDITNLYLQPALDLVWNGEATAKDAIGGIVADVTAKLAE